MRKVLCRLYTGVGEVPDTTVRKHSVKRKPYRNSKQIDCIKRTITYNNQLLTFINRNGGIEL
jgi:hypothetical protein